MSEDLVRRLGALLDTTEIREVRAKHAAQAILSERKYRWVGIYDVGDEKIELIGHTGVQAPVEIRGSVQDGLNGEAISSRGTVVSGDTTIVPILGAETGLVIGTLDVESDRGDSFGDEDRRLLEACAQALMPLFE